MLPRASAGPPPRSLLRIVRGAAVPPRREFFFSSRRRHTRSVSAFLLNRSSDLRKSKHSAMLRPINILCRVSLFLSMALCLLLRLFVFRLLRLRSEERRVGKECRYRWSAYL